MAARTRRWVSEVAGIASLAKMCLMCFSAALRVIQKVFAMPAFDCPLGHEREHLAFSWRERVEGVCPLSGREQFDDELGSRTVPPSLMRVSAPVSSSRSDIESLRR